MNDEKKLRVYVSGALTGVPEPEILKGFYEAIAEACEKADFEPYVPHLVSDPIQNPDMTPREVYELDKEQVTRADLVIAYVGEPSLGVGSEIEIARQNGISVILMMKEGVRVSRMARGNPAVTAELRFKGYEDGVRKLTEFLSSDDVLGILAK